MMKRFTGAVLVLITALSASHSTFATPLGYEDARHLLNRTSFAASKSEIERFAALKREQAIEELLRTRVVSAKNPIPDWGDKYERIYRPQMTQEERQMITRREMVVRGLELRSWWMAEMLTTTSPLTEKMTLFWHNHFATGQEKVRSATLMLRQNQMLRKHALGNFGAMLRDVSKDPAMLVYLDQASSRKGNPNENFARELMELFTLGEGNYTERDVKEAARALTGWSFDADAGEFRYRPAIHDTESKTILGKTGKFGGDDVVTILLAHPKTAEFITRKLWLELVSPTPDEAQVKKLAEVFRQSNYEIRALLGAMLTSDAFFAEDNRASLIKSPVDLVVGTLRQFKFEVHDAAPFTVLVRQMGQDLFQPPNVRGWPGGEVWINTNSLLHRKSFLNRLFRENEMSAGSLMTTVLDREGVMNESGRSRQLARLAMRPEQRGQLRDQYYFDSKQFLNEFGSPVPVAMAGVQRTALATPPVQSEMMELSLGGLRALVLDPAYQLK
jgi:uncharacterized protein (DUF1800 family)